MDRMANNAQTMSYPQRLHTLNISWLLARCHPHSALACTIVHPPTETIYVKQDNLWHLYRPTTRSHTSVSFITTSHDPPPTDTLPTTTDPTTDHRHQLQIYTHLFKPRRHHHIPTTSIKLLPAIPTQSPHPRTMGRQPCTSSISNRHEQFSRSNTHQRLRTWLRRLSQRTIYHLLLQSNSIPLYATHTYHQPL